MKDINPFWAGFFVGVFVMVVLTSCGSSDAHADADTEARSMRALESIAKSLKKRCK